MPLFFSWRLGDVQGVEEIKIDILEKNFLRDAWPAPVCFFRMTFL